MGIVTLEGLVQFEKFEDLEALLDFVGNEGRLRSDAGDIQDADLKSLEAASKKLTGLKQHGLALDDVQEGAFSLILDHFDESADEVELVADLRYLNFLALQGRYLEVKRTQ